jgi:hypothetical protein
MRPNRWSKQICPDVAAPYMVTHPSQINKAGHPTFVFYGNARQHIMVPHRGKIRIDGNILAAKCLTIKTNGVPAHDESPRRCSRPTS